MPFLMPTYPGLGIAVVRVMASIMVIVQGFQAYFISGMGASVNLFTQVGVPAPEITAPIVRTFELVGGILVLLGLATRWLALWFIFEFLYIITSFKLARLGWDATRIDFMLLASAIMLVLAGAGAPSLDAWLQRRNAARATEPETAAP